jgi:hypothetical protein
MSSYRIWPGRRILTKRIRDLGDKLSVFLFRPKSNSCFPAGGGRGILRVTCSFKAAKLSALVLSPSFEPVVKPAISDFRPFCPPSSFLVFTDDVILGRTLLRIVLETVPDEPSVSILEAGLVLAWLAFAAVAEPASVLLARVAVRFEMEIEPDARLKLDHARTGAARTTENRSLEVSIDHRVVLTVKIVDSLAISPT